MPNTDIKTKQAKIWSELSESSKDFIRDSFPIEDKEEGGYDLALAEVLDKVFGLDNVFPEPVIKTWKDVQDMNEDSNFFVQINDNLELPEKVYDKCKATMKIKKIIDLGYNGSITDEEWRNDKMEKFRVIPFKHGGFQVIRCYSIQQKDILAFRTRKLAEEFISYDSNNNLAERYYML